MFSALVKTESMFVCVIALEFKNNAHTHTHTQVAVVVFNYSKNHQLPHTGKEALAIILALLFRQASRFYTPPLVGLLLYWTTSVHGQYSTADHSTLVPLRPDLLHTDQHL